MAEHRFSPAERAELKEMARNFARRRRRVDEERSRQIAQRQVEASAQIQRLLGEFRAADPDVRTIILFGSLAVGTPTNPKFDIDIAVDSDRYWDLLGIALDQPIPVDLADLPRTSEHIRARILAEGTVLYAR
jgi:predicted nucleotidyltransferase